MGGSGFSMSENLRRHRSVIEHGEDQPSRVGLLGAGKAIGGDYLQNCAISQEREWPPWKPPRVADLGGKVLRHASYLKAGAITGGDGVSAVLLID